MARPAKGAGVSAQLTDRSQLTDHLKSRFSNNQFIGFENEKPAFYRPFGVGRPRPVSYEQIRKFLESYERHACEGGLNLKRIEESNDLPPKGNPVSDGIKRTYFIGLDYDNGASVTLEPSAQVEISGAPYASLYDVNKEYMEHLELCEKACKDSDLEMASLGCNPFFTSNILDIVPKRRYEIFLNALNRAQVGWHLATLTSTTQVNLDIRDEEDFAVKLQTGLSLQPVVTAIFANSPFEDGVLTGYKSFRSHIWARTGLNRTGIPEFVFKDDFGVEDYVDYLFDELRMLAIAREDDIYPARGGTLQNFIDGHYKDGNMADEGVFNPAFIDQTPILADALDSCGTIWWEVRPTRRGGIEFRGCDNGTPENNMAIAAIWTGLMYDEANLHELHQRVMQWSSDQRQALYHGAAKDALDYEFEGRKLQHFAKEIVEMARNGLERRAKALGIDSGVEYLAPVEEIVRTGLTPADHLINWYQDQVRQHGKDFDPKSILTRTSIWPQYDNDNDNNKNALSAVPIAKAFNS